MAISVVCRLRGSPAGRIGEERSDLRLTREPIQPKLQLCRCDESAARSWADALIASIRRGDHRTDLYPVAGISVSAPFGDKPCGAPDCTASYENSCFDHVVPKM